MTVRTGLARGVLAGVLVAAMAAFVAEPAGSTARVPAAAAKLTVEAGLPSGNFMPGRPMPVRVKVSSDRLVKGELQVQLKGFGNGVPTVLPVEVAGGNPKVFTVVVPTTPTEDRVEVVASLGGASVSATASFADDVELVGLLPGLTEETPAQVPMPMDLGTMRFVQLDESLLAQPGAVGPLGTIVAGPEGLADLDDRVRANLLTWIEAGGHLAVDSAVGDDVEGLPAEWQPGESGRVTAGRGEVRAVAGAAARGRWAEVVEATTLVEWIDPMMRNSFMENEVSNSLAKGSGLKLPDATWLIAFLVVYVLVVGPLAFLAVRRAKRLRNVAWVAIGGLAAVFTAGAFVGGRDIRSNTRAAHATFVESGVSGTRVHSYLGLISPSGTDPRVAMPEGWSAESYVSPWGMDMTTSGLEAVELGSDGLSGRMGLEAGGFGLMVGTGPAAASVPGIEVTAAAGADGTISGTVRNATDHPLRKVIVLVGRRTWEGDTLAAGEQVEWSLKVGEGDENDDGGAPEEEWMNWNRNPSEDPAVDYALWTQARYNDLDPYAPGWATAAGWTDEWAPPIDVGDTLEGRTVFTSRARITTAANGFPVESVQRQVLRNVRNPDLDDNEMGVSGRSLITRFTLPEGADPATPLEAVFASAVSGFDVWDGSRWRNVPCGNVEDNDDPWGGREQEAICPIPAGMVRGGQLQLRVHTFDESQYWPGALIGAEGLAR